MLGKGLESLIPKKNQQTDDQQTQPGGEDFSFQKPNPQNPLLPKTNIQNKEEGNKLENISIVNMTDKNLKTTNPESDARQTEQRENLLENNNKENSIPLQELGLDPNTQPPLKNTDFQPHQKIKPITKEAIFHIEVDKIKPNPHQPRRDFNEESLKELAASIREFGILQPLVVSKIEKEKEFGTEVEYQLIAGERRLMAAKMLGLERVPAIIRNVSRKSEQLAIAIIENLQRANLNPIETARAYAKLQDEFGLTQREIAAQIGKSRETVANTLRLLNLPSEIQDALAKNQINESQARLLLTIDDPFQQQNLFKQLLTNNLSVRELRSRIRGHKQPSANNQQQIIIDPEIHHLQEKLTELLGAKVKIEPTEKGGKIIITFYSPEEIQGIIDKLKTNNDY